MNTAELLINAALITWPCALMLSRRRMVAADQPNRSLSPNENVQIWITSFLNPVWAGLVFYYGWRKPLPIMAKQANRISFIAFGIEILIFGIVMFVLFVLIPGHSQSKRLMGRSDLHYSRTDAVGDETAFVDVQQADASSVEVSGAAVSGTDVVQGGEFDAIVPVDGTSAVYQATSSLATDKTPCTLAFTFSANALHVKTSNLASCERDPLYWGAGTDFTGDYSLVNEKSMLGGDVVDALAKGAAMSTTTTQ